MKRKTPWIVIACCLSAAWMLRGSSTALGFQKQVILLRTNSPESSQSTDQGLSPPNDQDAARWLKRAEEAAARKDWKLAADTLDRVIAQHGAQTVSLDEGAHFSSAIRLAQEQIAHWPTEGLNAYRVLYDPPAERLLQEAKKKVDLDILREITQKYPFTSVGPEAFDLLSGWLIDRGQISEAIDLLARLSTLPHSRISQWTILQKQTIAYTLSNQRNRAAELLRKMRSLTPQSDPTLPEDWAKQVDTIQRFFEDTKLTSQRHPQDRGTEVWPYRLGPSWANGRMSHVDPVITEGFNWSAVLPGADGLNQRTVQRIIQRRNRPPVWQAVTDGRRLFVTCPSGMIARDLATFDFLWKAKTKYRHHNPRIESHRLQAGMRDMLSFVDDTERLDVMTTRTLFHEYRGEVSTAFGLVYVIEQDGTPGEQYPTPQGILPANSVIDAEAITEPNTLRAYEADTGRAVWTLGRGSRPNDPLRSAHFYAAPTTAGPFLITPYAHHNDLFLAVLRPTGEVIKQVLLGTGRAGVFPMNGALPPLVRDGVIIVQTGAGLLIALNEHDFSLRWLTKYRRSKHLKSLQSAGRAVWNPNNRVSAQADEWLTCPPVIQSDVVVTAPLDSERLLAFHLKDGRLLWSVPRRKYRYIVGEDDKRVIVAGETIAAFDILSGDELWTTEKMNLSGRPAICDQSVLVPTIHGLVRLDLKSGEPSGELLKAPEPLGNLFAFGGSLYSLSPDRIAKFPDPKHSLSLFQARLDKDPDDVEALIGLSWLRSLKEDWPGVLDLLDRAEAAASRITEPPMASNATATAQWKERLLSRIAHHRVSALMNLSTEADLPQRRSLFEKALASARRPGDRVRAGLALSESFADQEEMLKGFRLSVSLLSEAGDQPIQLESNLKAQAYVLIGEYLQRFWKGMSSEDRSSALSYLDTTLEDHSAKARADFLVRLADCVHFLPLAARYDLQLGKQAIAKGRQETGIFYLQRAADRAETATVELEALLRLAIAYRYPGKGLPTSPAQTWKILKQLASQYAEARIPDSFETAAGETRPKTVSAFIEQIKSTLPKVLSKEDSPIPWMLTGKHRLGLLYELPVMGGLPQDSSSFWDRNRRQDIFAEVLPLQVSRQIRGIKLNGDLSGRTFWSDDLNWEGEELFYYNRLPEFKSQSEALAGRVAVLSTPTQLLAVGMTSGRMMWPPLEIDRSQGPLPEPSVINIDGMIIAAADSNTLVALPARDDARPVWRRRWQAAHPLRSLHAVNGLLLVLDRQAQQATILDPQNGRIRREYVLGAGQSQEDTKESEAAGAFAPSVVVGNIICQCNGKEVVGRDAMTGNTLWAIQVQDKIRSLLALGEHHLGISTLPNGFKVIRAESGEGVIEVTTTEFAMPLLDAVVDYPTISGASRGGRLLLFAKTKGARPEYFLQSFSLNDSKDTWRRALGPLASISRQMMRASPDYVAVVRYGVTTERQNRRIKSGVQILDRRVPPRLEIVHKPSGRRVGPIPYEFSEGLLGGKTGRLGQMVSRPLHASRMITDVIVLNKRIIAVAPEGVYILSDVRKEARSD